MTLMTFVRDPGERALAAIVVNDGEVSYVWPGDAVPDPPPTTPVADGDDGQLLLDAAQPLGIPDHPYDDFESVEEATEFARGYLVAQPEPVNPLTQQADDAFGQISRDYPGFDDLLIEGGEEGELPPGAIDNYVMLLMGPIDPEGENGWVFRAVDGEPREGDEDQYLHLPTLGEST